MPACADQEFQLNKMADLHGNKKKIYSILKTVYSHRPGTSINQMNATKFTCKNMQLPI